jgi:excisionase family DNA binding protein
MAEEVLTVHEVAALLKTTPATVYSWCRAGKLPAFKIGQQWRIRAQALDEMMRSGGLYQTGGVQVGEKLAK